MQHSSIFGFSNFFLVLMQKFENNFVFFPLILCNYLRLYSCNPCLLATRFWFWFWLCMHVFVQSSHTSGCSFISPVSGTLIKCCQKRQIRMHQTSHSGRLQLCCEEQIKARVRITYGDFGLEQAPISRDGATLG